MGSPKLTPRPRCHKKLVPRRSVDAINVEVDERLGRGYPPGNYHIPPWEKENHLQNAIFGGYVSSLESRRDMTWGLGFEVYVFFGGFLGDSMFFFANRSWDVVFFVVGWMWMEREFV